MNAVRYDFSDQVTVVTGAGSGIGATCARALATAGARVAVADVDHAAARDVATQLGDRGRAFTVDVADPDSASALVDAVLVEFGGLHLAVNNAGINAPVVPLAECTVADWRRVLGVNLDGMFYCLRAEVAALRAAGAGGAIVNMASVLGMVATAHASAYVAAKHGVVGLTKVAALDHAADGIRVNAVAPGFIRTAQVEANVGPERMPEVASLHPIGRIGEPDEVAALVLWLLSPAAGNVTGACYPVDGGYSIR